MQRQNQIHPRQRVIKRSHSAGRDNCQRTVFRQHVLQLSQCRKRHNGVSQPVGHPDHYAVAHGFGRDRGDRERRGAEFTADVQRMQQLVQWFRHDFECGCSPQSVAAGCRFASFQRVSNSSMPASAGAMPRRFNSFSTS